jgi:hypothetical protein
LDLKADALPGRGIVASVAGRGRETIGRIGNVESRRPRRVRGRDLGRQTEMPQKRSMTAASSMSAIFGKPALVEPQQA